MALYIRPRNKVQAEKAHFPTLEQQVQNVKNGIYSLQNGISQSLMTNWACRYKFIMKLNKWTTLESGKNTYYGSIVHYVLENLYRKGKNTLPLDIEEWINQFIRQYEKEMKVWTSDNIHFVAKMCAIVLKEYFNYYFDDFDEMTIHTVESKFNVPFHNTHLLGMRDLLFSYKGKNGKWIMEHKSMGRVVEKILLQRLRIDKQILFYATATEQEYDLLIDGVLFNVIRRPQLKFDEMKEDKTDFLKRLHDDILERPEFYFIRYPVTFTQKDKQIFKEELTKKLDDIQDFLSGKLRVYREEDMCESAYNGSPYVCEYIDVCSTGIIKGMIQQKSWFPELE